MKQSLFTIVSNRQIAPLTYEIVLSGDTSAVVQPGQFVNIKLDGYFLRRPISVCDKNNDQLTLIYKTVGRGTEALSRYPAGKVLDVLTGLGNGYDFSDSGAAPALIGGGAGVPPMVWAAKVLMASGITPHVILGFNTVSEIFGVEKFRVLGIEPIICTADGSQGIKGFVTEGLASVDYTYTFACGPIPMLRAIYSSTSVGGQYSFEERMGCGFGACVGCTCKTKYGNKRICKDGPVLKKEEIIW